MTTRPITDRVKEHLFEVLRFELDGRRVADVFSGTGSLGLEAVSRGALSSVCIENDHMAHELLKRNVAKLGIDDEILCWRTDAIKTSFRPKGREDLYPYSLVFFDPPYRMISGLVPGTPLHKCLARLARADVTVPGARLVLRTPRDAVFEMPSQWQLDETISISKMELHLFRNATAEQESA